jgi:hypothetical protein
VQLNVGHRVFSSVPESLTFSKSIPCSFTALTRRISSLF